MRKLPPVEEAKALMSEAKDWGVWKWLFEKRRVRAAADAAWAALEEAERRAKLAWPDELKRAYDDLAGRGKRGTKSPELKAVAQRVKQCDAQAYRAHMDAEDLFAEAEKSLNTGLARQGAALAIEAWELTEKAIRQAEAAARLTSRASTGPAPSSPQAKSRSVGG